MATRSRSKDTASRKASSQNCIWSHSEDRSLPISPSKRYVRPPSGLGLPEVVSMAPPWYRKPVLKLLLLDHTDGLRCFWGRGNWKIKVKSNINYLRNFSKPCQFTFMDFYKGIRSISCYKAALPNFFLHGIPIWGSSMIGALLFRLSSSPYDFAENKFKKPAPPIFLIWLQKLKDPTNSPFFSITMCNPVKVFRYVSIFDSAYKNLHFHYRPLSQRQCCGRRHGDEWRRGWWRCCLRQRRTRTEPLLPTDHSPLPIQRYVRKFFQDMLSSWYYNQLQLLSYLVRIFKTICLRFLLTYFLRKYFS